MLLKSITFVVLLGFKEEVITVAGYIFSPLETDFEKLFCLFVILPVFFYVYEKKVSYHGDSVRTLYNNLQEEDQF